MPVIDGKYVYYKLVDKKVVATTDHPTEGARRVGRDEIGDSLVSTVFLPIDHGYGSQERPVVFETMVFGGPLEGECERYSTWEEAEAGHRAMCLRVSAGGTSPTPLKDA